MSLNETEGFLDLASLRGAAPTLFQKIGANPANKNIEYLGLQIIALLSGGHLQPLEEYCSYETNEKSVVDLRESETKMFSGGGNHIEKLTVIGKGRVLIWFGDGCRIRNVLIHAPASGRISSIVFGPHTEIYDCVIQADTNSPTISISSGTTLLGGNIYLSEPDGFLSIGDDCMFSTNVAMRTSDSHAIYDIATGKRINHARPIILRRHVWVGRAAILNKGTTVEENAVIGQASVCSGILRGGCIHAGHPARPIREGTYWDRTLAETIDEAMDVHPSRTRQVNHARFCARIDALPTETLTGISPINIASRLLLADHPDDVVKASIDSVRSAGGDGDDIAICLEAHRLRLLASRRTLPSWLY